MSSVEDLFDKLNADLAPGQEKRLKFDDIELRGDNLPGEPVDFSHGDVDAFEPIPGCPVPCGRCNDYTRR